MIWSRKQLVGLRMAHDEVNPRMLELEIAEEILRELFDNQTREVDEMIRQRMEERTFPEMILDLVSSGFSTFFDRHKL
ncbi:MAG: hypothetical protein LUQ38_07985 [Methanotrichaceae archaeon]|nr:hypothetical protein [Methanotrichaceae archaeon]